MMSRHELIDLAVKLKLGTVEQLEACRTGEIKAKIQTAEETQQQQLQHYVPQQSPRQQSVQLQLQHHHISNSTQQAVRMDDHSHTTTSSFTSVHGSGHDHSFYRPPTLSQDVQSQRTPLSIAPPRPPSTASLLASSASMPFSSRRMTVDPTAPPYRLNRVDPHESQRNEAIPGSLTSINVIASTVNSNTPMHVEASTAANTNPTSVVEFNTENTFASLQVCHQRVVEHFQQECLRSVLNDSHLPLRPRLNRVESLHTLILQEGNTSTQHTTTHLKASGFDDDECRMYLKERSQRVASLWQEYVNARGAWCVELQECIQKRAVALGQLLDPSSRVELQSAMRNQRSNTSGLTDSFAMYATRKQELLEEAVRLEEACMVLIGTLTKSMYWLQQPKQSIQPKQ